MSPGDEGAYEYPDTVIAALETIWGEGFLSPGGADEVARLLDGVSLEGCDVLDVGCGIGGIDVLLVEVHGAKSVLGIDVEQPVLDRATAHAAAAGLGGRVSYRLVAPGPFSLDDAAFDVVFSKDAMVHIADKPALYAEVMRVLRPGGTFVASDWLKDAGDPSPAVAAWLDTIGLTFHMETPEGSANALAGVGFVDVRMRDRTEWYRELARAEVARMRDELRPRFVEVWGEEDAERWFENKRHKVRVLERGEMHPTHLWARKPA